MIISLMNEVINFCIKRTDQNENDPMTYSHRIIYDAEMSIHPNEWRSIEE